LELAGRDAIACYTVLAGIIWFIRVSFPTLQSHCYSQPDVQWWARHLCGASPDPLSPRWQIPAKILFIRLACHRDPTKLPHRLYPATWTPPWPSVVGSQGLSWVLNLCLF